MINNKLNYFKGLTYKTEKIYNSVLNRLYKDLGINQPLNKEYFIYNQKAILKKINEYNINSAKTIISAIISLLDDTIKEKAIYRDKLMDLINKIKIFNDKNIKTNKQMMNDINNTEIKYIYDYLYKKYKILNLNDKLTDNDFNIFQNFILFCLISGIYIEPRRLLDYTNLRYINNNEDNIYINGQFIFRKYKTNKTYGQQNIDIPVKLNNILKKYVNYRLNYDNKTDYFFINSNKNKLSESSMNQLINKIYNDIIDTDIKPGINGFRHLYISNLYKDLQPLEKINKSAYNMAHNMETHLSYIKR